MTAFSHICHLVEEATGELVLWAEMARTLADTDLEAAQAVAARLGVHYNPESGYTEAGFWLPELVTGDIWAEEVFLEILFLIDPIDYGARRQTIRLWQERLNLHQDDEFLWGVIEGLEPGSREEWGVFYWLTYQDEAGQWQAITDPLAYSLPFGPFAPAEYYDPASLVRERADRDYFARLDTTPDPDGTARISPPANPLQVRPTAAGSLAGLTARYRAAGQKVGQGQPLTPAEKEQTGGDAIRLALPEPGGLYRSKIPLWKQVDEDPDYHTVVVNVRRPRQATWSQDLFIAASPAVNPAVLATGRPDELGELVATLHTFPQQPFKVEAEVTFSPAPLLSRHPLAGQPPLVRAILLEAQQRKSHFGLDGFTLKEAQAEEYLELINNVEYELAGQRYRPWITRTGPAPKETD